MSQTPAQTQSPEGPSAQMEPGDSRRALVPESPVVVSEATALGKLVGSVYERMSELDVSAHGQVLALYGGRGTGKTSALLTLLARLRKANADRSDLAVEERPTRIEWLLPRIRRGSDEPLDSPRQLFVPEYSRVDDDLLFMLLAYLENRYQPEVKEAIQSLANRKTASPLTRIRWAEVRRRMPERFFAFERDSSVSSKDLPRRLVRSQVRVTQATESIRDSFQQLIRCLTADPKPPSRPHNRRLVLFVDDLDLQPQRALDLLELIQLFLLHPQVIVVLTADREQLIHSLAVSLRRREADPKGPATIDSSQGERLAQAFLRKWVPIGFDLPRPSMEERWAFRPQSRPQSMKDAESIAQRMVGEFWQTAEERFRDGSHFDVAKEYVTPLLPNTYRGMISLYNRISTFDKMRWVSTARKSQFGLQPAMVEPFLSLLLSIEVRHPELGLLELLEDFERDFLSELYGMVVREETTIDRDREQGTHDDRLAPEGKDLRRTSPEQTPLLSERLRPLLSLELRRAQEHLASLAQSWFKLSDEGTPHRLLYISLNANAQERGQRLAGRTRYTRVDSLDLTEFAKGGRAEPDQLQAARDKATSSLSGLAFPGDIQARVDILAKAQLPLLLWLGFKLRYLSHVTMYNDSVRGLDPFEVPAERVLQPEKGREYIRLHPVAESQESAELLSHPNDALVIVDFLGRSQPDQLGRFQGKDQQPLRTKVSTRLVPIGEVQPLSSPQQLQEVITDVLQHLYALQGQGIDRFHLVLIGPDVLAFFLGQQLNAWTISLYEFYAEQRQYRYVFDLSE